MKKILLAFDAYHFSEGAFEFARRLNELQPILLTGVFLPREATAGLWNYADGMTEPFLYAYTSLEESEKTRENRNRFEKLCQGNNIDYRVHKEDFGFTLHELERETRFADLLIIGSEKFYGNPGNMKINDYLKDVLHGTECPVLLVPEHYSFPENIILAYDGSASSAFAMKQFSCALPALATREVLLVYATDNPDDDFPEMIQLEEFAARHFPNLTFYKLDTNPKKYFATWMADEKNAMLVCGSYGRSGFSELFRKNFVHEVITDHRLPVFIAHQ